ncbi:MAG: class I SAM-dependent methyltransferase [Minisyncoccia bacterium]
MFSDPIKNLKQFGLREDIVVADLGAGTGFYSIPLAQIVSKGKVYAIEIQKDFLITIKNKIKEANLNNIECLLGNIEKIGGTNLTDKVLDAAVVSNVLFQVENKDKFIEEINRILKTEGRVLIIDWLDDSVFAPSKFKIISGNDMRSMFEKKGFIFERDINAGDHHYGMIFKKG